MYDLEQAIHERHSTRKFLPRPVPRKLLEEALALAQHAPSNSNIQPWRMVFASGAALAWAEAVTRVADGVPDPVYSEARQHFTDKELVDLTWAVIAINGWNRVAISLCAVPGSYPPKNQPA
jgi:nitroreductase